MVVEELLELLVDVVDADLFKAIVVEDLEAGDVEDADVGDLLHGGVAQGLVALLHNNPEKRDLEVFNFSFTNYCHLNVLRDRLLLSLLLLLLLSLSSDAYLNVRS